MELQRALSQISEIHAQVLRSEVFRGYRAVPMAITAALAVLAAGVQATWLRPLDVGAFAAWWLGVCGLCAVVCGVDLCLRLRVEDGVRGRLAPVLAQFLPSLIAGAAVTAVLLSSEPAAAGRLPGWWALLFGLGVCSSRPYLHRAVGWVGAFYVAAGVLLLALSAPDGVPSPWTMGATFGAGQAALAAVLYWHVERREECDGG
jgi:hypothetical protein